MFDKITITLVLLLAISGCSQQIKPPNPPAPYEKPEFSIPEPTPLNLLSVETDVKIVDGESLITMDSTAFSNWMLNNKRIEQYIKSQKNFIEKLKNYYKD